MTGWSIHPLQRNLGKHAADWDALNAGVFGNHPMLTSPFINGLLQNFGDGSEWLCVCKDGDKVQAMCLLCRKSAFLWTSFLPSQAQLGPTMMPDAALLPGLLRSLPGHVQRLDLLCNDSLVGGLVSKTDTPVKRFNHALTIQVSLADSFGAYWNSRSKNLQSNFKRYEKKLQADGLTQRHIKVTQPDQIVAAVDRYAALEGSGWKGFEGTALGSKPDQLQFYQQLMFDFAQHNDAVVHELWFGVHLVASRLVIWRNQMLIILKTTYDESLARYAPGRLQLRAVIEDAFFTNPGGQLEFYTDATPDQLAWATDSRWIAHLSHYRTQTATLLVTAMRALHANRALPVSTTDDKTAATVDVFEQPDALPPEAKRLLTLAEQHNVELGLAWYQNLVNTVYPDCNDVRFYVLRKGTQVLAVLPLRAEKARLGWRLHALSNYYTALYEPAMVPNLKPHDFATLLAVVRHDFAGASSFRMTPMDRASHSYQTLLGALQLQGWIPFEFFAFGNWYLPIKDCWQDYLADRDGKLRHTIERMGKKFAKAGGKLEILTKPADLSVGIDAYTTIYAKSWKKPEPYPDFMPGLMKTCAEKGWLRLGVAWLDGQPIAAQVWIVAHGRAEIYKLAYDEHFKAYAPGTLLSALLMQHAIEVDQVREVDYLIGDDPHKKTWMSHRQERLGIVAYNPLTLMGLAGLVREVVGRAVKPWIVRIRAKRHSPGK